MKFVLTCGCGSTDFRYDEKKGFICKECGTGYTEEEAGHELLGDCDDF